MSSVLNYIINMQNGTFGAGVNQAQQQVSKLDSLVGKATASLGALATIGFAKQLMNDTTELATKFEQLTNKMEFASGSNAAENTAFLKNTIESLKMPLESTTEGYANYLGVVKGTNLEGEKGNKIFGDIATGFKGARLSVEQQERAMGALYKMISTGNVQADEFKQQFAEAIPGAMALAEKATGMTMQQFTKEMEKGNINSIQFIEQFSAVMRHEYEQNLPAALNGFDSKINMATNSILQQKIAIGEQLVPAKIAWLNLQLAGLQIINTAITFYRENETVINTLAMAIGGATVAYYGMLMVSRAYLVMQGVVNTVTALYTAYTVAASYGTTGWAGAMWALNAAMAANPIGLIIVAIGALVGALVYAWHHSENFRATMMGVWQVMKDLFEIWVRIITMPLRLVFDPASFFDNINKVKDLALGLGDSYTRGRAEEFAKSANKTNTAPATPGMHNLTSLTGGATTLAPKKTATTTAGKTGESSAGGRSVRNITLNFKSAINEVKITTSNIQNLSHTDLVKIVEQVIVGAANNAEVMIANN